LTGPGGAAHGGPDDEHDAAGEQRVREDVGLPARAPAPVGEQSEEPRSQQRRPATAEPPGDVEDRDRRERQHRDLEGDDPARAGPEPPGRGDDADVADVGTIRRAQVLAVEQPGRTSEIAPRVHAELDAVGQQDGRRLGRQHGGDREYREKEQPSARSPDHEARTL
jgi:hypothetical protein